MASRFSLGSIALMVFACSQQSDKFTIGSPIDQNDAESMQVYEENGSPKFYSFDSAGRRINFVDPGGGSLSFSPDLGSGQEGQAWLASKGDGYAFSISDKAVTLYGPGSSSPRELVRLAGTIKSYAADFEQGYFAFVDEFFSIALVKLDGSGASLGQWTGGPIFPDNQTITAGEMIDNGKLLLATNSGRLFLVSLENSLQSESWTFESIDMGFDNPSWIGRIDGREDRALILDRDSLSLIDLNSKTVLDVKGVPSSVLTSKNGIDHVFYFEVDSNSNVFVYAGTDDTLTEARLKVDSSNPLSTYLSTTSLVAFTRNNEVVKLRLQDGLVRGKFSNRGNGRVGLAEGFAVSMYESSLGYIEVLNLDNGTTTTFQAFNLPVLQR